MKNLSATARRAIALSAVDGGRLRRLHEGMWSNSEWVSKHDPCTFVRTATINRLVDMGVMEWAAWETFPGGHPWVHSPIEVTLTEKAAEV